MELGSEKSICASFLFVFFEQQRQSLYQKARASVSRFWSDSTSYGRKKRKKWGIKILYVIWMLVPDLIIWTHALTKRIRERLRSSFLCGSKWVQIIRSGTSIQTTFIFWKWLRFIKHLEFSNKWLKINESEFRIELDHRFQRQTAWNRSLTYHIQTLTLKTLSSMCWFRLISI